MGNEDETSESHTSFFTTFKKEYSHIQNFKRDKAQTNKYITHVYYQIINAGVYLIENQLYESPSRLLIPTRPMLPWLFRLK